MALNIRQALPLGLLIVLALAGPAAAQKYQPFGPVWDEFGHDLAIFAPAEVSDFDGGPDPNEGFFLQYNRLYMGVNRSSFAQITTETDWTWGNRWTGGYMHPDNYGWLVEYIHVDGPTKGRPFDSFNQDNANDPDEILTFDPRPDENLAGFHSIEVSRQWRLPQLHDGSHVEIFGGIRYARFEQSSVSHPVDRVNPGGDPNLFPLDVPNLLGLTVSNDMYGAQVGLRWYKQKGRWVISSEGRFFGAYNHQIYTPQVIGGQLQDDTEFVVNGFNPRGFSEDRFVPMGDLRVEATYVLTKAFALSVGWEMMYIGNGVARQAPPFDNQDLLMTGLTFGFNVNR